MFSTCVLITPSWNIKFTNADTVFFWIYSCPRFKSWFVLIIFHQCLFVYEFSIRHLQKIIIYLEWNDSLNQAKLSNVIVILLHLLESGKFGKIIITLINFFCSSLCSRPNDTPTTVFKAHRYLYHCVQGPVVRQSCCVQGPAILHHCVQNLLVCPMPKR